MFSYKYYPQCFIYDRGINQSILFFHWFTPFYISVKDVVDHLMELYVLESMGLHVTLFCS